MSIYTRRLVANKDAKGCFICYKPTVVVLKSSSDLFYTCDVHLSDPQFATEVVDPSESKPQVDSPKNENSKPVNESNEAETAANINKSGAKALETTEAENDKGHETPPENSGATQQPDPQTAENLSNSDSKESQSQQLAKPLQKPAFKQYTLNPQIQAMRAPKRKIKTPAQLKRELINSLPSAPSHTPR